MSQMTAIEDFMARLTVDFLQMCNVVMKHASALEDFKKEFLSALGKWKSINMSTTPLC